MLNRVIVPHRWLEGAIIFFLLIVFRFISSYSVEFLTFIDVMGKNDNI